MAEKGFARILDTHLLLGLFTQFKNLKINFASKTHLLVKAKFGFSTSMRCIWAFKNTLISIPLANDDELKNLAGIFEAISGSSLPNPRL